MMRRRLSVLGMGIAVAAAGCGPGFQVIYEGDARFEHCYAIDENPNVLMQQKSDCWGDWLKRYTYGQTRDRVEYAAMRYHNIKQIHVAPTDEALMGAAPGEGTHSASISAPAPTSAFAPPPKTLAPSTAPTAEPDPPASMPPTSSSTSNAPPVTPVAPAPPPPAEAPRAPGADCTDGCWTAWQKCHDGCSAKGCDVCDKKYGRCVKACF